MDLIWRDLSENDERCTRLQLYSETDPGTAATFAVRCNSIIGVTSEENFSNDAMYLVEGVFPDNHTLQQIEMDWSFLQPLALEERHALLQGVSSIPSIQHISIRGGCNVAAAAIAAAQQHQPVVAAGAAAAAADGDDTSQQTTTTSSSSLQASVLNLSLLTLIPERSHATLISLSIEMAELTISNLNDLKLAANAFAQCHELESLHIRGLFLVLPQANDPNSNNNNDADDNETGHHNHNNAQQQQQLQQQQQKQPQPQHAGCYDVLLQALATLPKFHILHMSQKEDPNKPPSTTTIDSNTTDTVQQQATITCEALTLFCKLTISRLTCLSLLNMGLQDEHCDVLRQELRSSTCLTSLILIDNPCITESGNATLLQLLKQNRSIFNSTFGTDSDTQYRTQQLTFLHLNRCGRYHYKIASDNTNDNDDSTAADGSNKSYASSRQLRHRQVNKQQQQQRPEQGWIQYLTKINETVPEELELDALYCAILENPDFIRHASCQQLQTSSTTVAASKTVHKKMPQDDEVKVHKNHNKPSVVHDQLVDALSSPSQSSPTVPESTIPSIITTTTNHSHHHQSFPSSSLKKNNEVATLDQQDAACKDKDDSSPIMDTTTTPTESTCSSVDDAVSDLSSCGIEEEDHDNDNDGDDDKDNEDNEHNDAQEKDHNDAAVRIWPGSQLPPPRPSPQLDQDDDDDDDDAAEKTDNKNKQQQQDAYYMNQFRRLESKLAQRERQLWLREQALQTRMRHVLNREADLLQAEARIKEKANMPQEHQNNNATTTKNNNIQQQDQQGGLFFLPALFNTDAVLYHNNNNNNKSQHRVKIPQKTKMMTPLFQHHQAESEYCNTGNSPKTILIKKDSCLAVTRAEAYSLQPQDSSSSLEGRDDDVQQKQERQQHVVTGPTAAAAVVTTLPGLCMMTSSSSSSQSVSSLFLDFEKQTIATLEHVRDECWNLSSVSSFFQ